MIVLGRIRRNLEHRILAGPDEAGCDYCESRERTNRVAEHQHPITIVAHRYKTRARHRKGGGDGIGIQIQHLYHSLTSSVNRSTRHGHISGDIIW